MTSALPVMALTGRAAPVALPFLAENDVALVHGLLADNSAAKAAFFARYSSGVKRRITYLIGFDRELADILQEVFVQALSSIHNLRDPASLEPWLLRIATHCARRTLRTRSRRAWLRFFVDETDEDRHEPIANGMDIEGAQTVRAVYNVLLGMPRGDCIAFVLRYIEGMGLAEVADACSVSLPTIKRRLQRSERIFLRAARKHPLLDTWIKEGSRWRDR